MRTSAFLPRSATAWAAPLIPPARDGEQLDVVGLVKRVAGGADGHQQLSKALAEFAGEAREIVNAHNGMLIYAGDDVLAFLPADKCLECARKLHDKFRELLTTYGSLTLSVGIAIGHFMEADGNPVIFGRAFRRGRAGIRTAHGEKYLAVVSRDHHLPMTGGHVFKQRMDFADNPQYNFPLILISLSKGRIGSHYVAQGVYAE